MIYYYLGTSKEVLVMVSSLEYCEVPYFGGIGS